MLIILTYAISITELVLAGYFWKTNSGNVIRRLMVFMLFSTGLWVGTTAASVYQSPSAFADLFNKLVYVFGVFGLTTLLHFTLLWPIPKPWLIRFKVWIIYTPAVLFTILLLFTNLVVRAFIITPNSYGYIVAGPLLSLYNIYLLILFLAALIVSFSHYSPPPANTGIVWWSILIGGLPAVLLDLIGTSWLQIDSNPLIGVLANAVWVGAIVYIITKK